MHRKTCLSLYCCLKLAIIWPRDEKVAKHCEQFYSTNKKIPKIKTFCTIILLTMIDMINRTTNIFKYFHPDQFGVLLCLNSIKYFSYFQTQSTDFLPFYIMKL